MSEYFACFSLVFPWFGTERTSSKKSCFPFIVVEASRFGGFLSFLGFVFPLLLCLIFVFSVCVSSDYLKKAFFLILHKISHSQQMFSFSLSSLSFLVHSLLSVFSRSLLSSLVTVDGNSHRLWLRHCMASALPRQRWNTQTTQDFSYRENQEREERKRGRATCDL